jgi:hypothetical protein
MGRVHAMELDHGVAVHFWDNPATAAAESLHWLKLAKLKIGQGNC